MNKTPQEIEDIVWKSIGCGALSITEGLKLIKNLTNTHNHNQETPKPPIAPKPPGARVLNNGTSSIEDGFNHFCGGVISGFVIGVFTAMVILNLVNGG